MKRTKDAFDNICNIGVVTAGGTVSENWDRLACFDKPDEFIDRQIRALAWPVNGKEAQT